MAISADPRPRLFQESKELLVSGAPEAEGLMSMEGRESSSSGTSLDCSHTTNHA
jgi:hypothetical protein